MLANLGADALVAVLRALWSIGRQVGLIGLFMAFLVAVTFGAIVRLADRTLRLLGRIERWWRKRSNATKGFIVTFGALALAPTLLRHLPVKTTIVAVLLGFYVPYWVGARFWLADRYEVYESPWAVWRTHLRARAGRHQYQKGTDRATGKKHSRVRSYRPGADASTVIAEPGDGMSAEEMATEINDGKHRAAIAREMGWSNIAGMSAFPQDDGTVLVRVAHAPETGDDFFTTVKAWPGMEE